MPVRENRARPRSASGGVWGACSPPWVRICGFAMIGVFPPPMTAHPIDLDAFAAAPLVRTPFPYALVPRFVRPEAMAAINADFPLVRHPGSFPLPTLKYGPAF